MRRPESKKLFLKERVTSQNIKSEGDPLPVLSMILAKGLHFIMAPALVGNCKSTGNATLIPTLYSNSNKFRLNSFFLREEDRRNAHPMRL